MPARKAFAGRLRTVRTGAITVVALASCASAWLWAQRQGAATNSATSPTTSPAAAWRAPEPAGASQRVAERERMVQEQIAHPRDGRPAVVDPVVLQAMCTVPRHAFVPREFQAHAYADSPLPIGYGQTISQPYIVALMTEQLRLRPGDKVLEIGTGSGYQAAVLAQLSPEVYSVEIIRALAAQAKQTLEQQGYGQVHCRSGDGYYGWPEQAPFDAIIVTCAAGHLPPPLWEQLKPGGRILVPIGGVYEVQRLVVITKTADGHRRSISLMPVSFVPMRGQIERR